MFIAWQWLVFSALFLVAVFLTLWYTIGSRRVHTETERTAQVNAEVPFEVLCDDPRIVRWNGFLTAEECAEVVALGKPLLKRSRVMGKQPISSDRTSSSGFFRRAQTSLLQRIERRASGFAHLPVENVEPIQYLEYQLTQQYKPHWDYFLDHESGKKALQNGGQRKATVLIYLNDVEEGGATEFPQLGLSIQPRRGDALLWFNTLPNGSVDPRTMHAGRPVLRGEKQALNVWIRCEHYNA